MSAAVSSSGHVVASWGPARSDRDRPADARLARLAAAVGPLRRVLAAIAAQLVATRAYEPLCYARLSDYARERPGVSGRQLHDLARVHTALTELPALERALLVNALPWSKVRLLARVATPEDEVDWIARASALPTRRLEQEVRRRAEGPDPEHPVPTRQLAVSCTPALREKWTVVCEVAERVAGCLLRGPEVVECIVAEAFSAVSIDPAFAGPCGEPTGQRRRVDASPAGETAPEVRVPARSLPQAVVSLATGLEEADARELDRRLRCAVHLEQTLDAAMAPLLRIVRCADYTWSGDDYRTLSGYARDALGMSARKARALVRLERASDVCPELRRAYRRGRLSWVKAQCLLPLLRLDAEGDWRRAWIDWAERVTVRRLAADVERALLLRAAHHRAWQRCKFHPEQAQDPIPSDERQLCAHDVDPDATETLRWRLPRDVALLFTAVWATLRAKLPGRDPFEAMLDHALATWLARDRAAPRPDPVIARDGYRCAVPGCSSRRNLHDHHIVFRSAGGSDAPENRITLCAFHHQRCLHAGRLRIVGRAPRALRFELPLGCYRSGDVAA